MLGSAFLNSAIESSAFLSFAGSQAANAVPTTPTVKHSTTSPKIRFPIILFSSAFPRQGSTGQAFYPVSPIAEMRDLLVLRKGKLPHDRRSGVDPERGRALWLSRKLAQRSSDAGISEGQEPGLGGAESRRRCRLLQKAGAAASAGISVDRLFGQPGAGQRDRGSRPRRVVRASE